MEKPQEGAGLVERGEGRRMVVLTTFFFSRGTGFGSLAFV